jgi:hypothetical protein
LTLSPFDSVEDEFGIGRPDKKLWIGVGFGNEAIDGGFEIIHGSEHAALEAASRKLCEEAFDSVEP